MLTETHSASLTTETVAPRPLPIDATWRALRPRVTLSSSHYWMTFVLALLFFPLAAATRLVFEPPIFLLVLFTKVACSGIIVAAALHVIDTPVKVTIESFRRHPERLLMPAAMAASFVTLLGGAAGLFLALVAFVVVEFFYRNPDNRLALVRSMLLPALYLALGITLMWEYNDIAVSLRFPGTYDAAFMRLDSLFGIDVPALSKEAVAFSPRVLVWAEQVYFRMFDILAATLILIVVRRGPRRAMQFVGAVVFAYYMTLVLFLLFPSQGPYYLCVDHASTFPKDLYSYSLHMSLLAQAREVWEHTSTMVVTGGYFISFPCMHVVKPTVALWHLRSHRRLAMFLIGYLILLPIAIVVLEMHYFVDIPVGFALAGLGILISDSDARLRLRTWLRTLRPAVLPEAAA